jgi:diguanylate cyclase (GGDEF)-like protein
MADSSDSPLSGRRAATSEQADAVAAALFDGSDEMVVLVHGGGSARLLSGATVLENLTGQRFDELVKDPLSVLREADAVRVRSAFNAALRAPTGERSHIDFFVQHRGGYLVQLRAVAINRMGDGVLNGLLLRVREDRASESVHPPIHDPDAEPESARGRGRVNRERFLEAVQRSVQRKLERVWTASRHARQVARDRRYDYTVVLLELDRFKMLVGGFGQDIADNVVSQVAERVGTVLRGRDVFAHLGGGEFGILLDAVGDEAHATQVSARIQEAFDTRFDVGGHALAVTATLGIATSERRYQRAEEVMRDAAAAAAHAHTKRTRRRRAAFNSQMRVADQELMQLIVSMNEAIDEEQFSVAYQPIVSLETGELDGFEALARWNHSELGQVPPSRFIPVAEEAGLIGELGGWVMRQACEQVAAWNAVYRPARQLSVAVNVASDQLSSDSFVKQVESVLRETGLAPERLKLEITESVVLNNLDAVVGVIARLRLYGVTFSLDDFGTGYSSLSYLHRLPYDVIKIDRSFLSDTGTKNRSVVAAIVSMARSLEMAVVAEGVETAEQRATLLDIGCEFAQGYYFARPMAPADAERLVASGDALPLSV